MSEHGNLLCVRLIYYVKNWVLGPGTFSQEAMLRHVGNRKHDDAAMLLYRDAVRNCSGEIEEAIAPIENSRAC